MDGQPFNFVHNQGFNMAKIILKGLKKSKQEI